MDLSIREFLRKFDAGDFNSEDVNVQFDAGWFDWFCKDSALKAKTQKLAAKLKSLLPSSKIDIDKHYVFFKNNCPLRGPLFDDFRICNLNSQETTVVWTIIPRSGHSGKAEVWGRANDFDEPVIEGSWKDVVKYFKNQ
jgi:hypothetical protein